MTRIEYLFTDIVVHREVNLYRDSCGRLWMAHGPSDLFRVEYPHAEMKAIELEARETIRLIS